MERHGCGAEEGDEELLLLRNAGSQHLALINTRAIHEPSPRHDEQEPGEEDEGEETDGEDLLDVVHQHHQQSGEHYQKQDEGVEEAARPLPFALLGHELHLQLDHHHGPFSDHHHEQPSLPPPPGAIPYQGGEYHHQHQHQLELQLLQAGVVGEVCGAAVALDSSSTASTATSTASTTAVVGGRRPPADFRCTSSSEEKWERKFQELVEFKRAHSSFKPLKKANRRLYWWVKDQRSFFRESRLPGHRMEKLVQVGLFEGDTRTVGAKWDDVWEERFSELVSFKEQHGHTLVPNKANAALYAWVRSQRLAKSKGRLHDTRKRRLDEIEFCWTGKQGEAPRPSPGAGGGSGAKRQKLEIVVDDDQRQAPPYFAPAATLLHAAPNASPALMSLPPGLGVEGLNIDHQLFFQQHAALVHQLEQAVAKEETLSLTLAFAPPAGPKTEKTEGEVKDFLDLLSSQNRLVQDISEPAAAAATSTREHEGRSPIYDDPPRQATAKRPPRPSDDNALLLRPTPPQQ